MPLHLSVDLSNSIAPDSGKGRVATMRARGFRFRFSPWLCALMILCFAGPVNAQSRNATISGHVTDSDGGVLQGAAIGVQPGGASTVSDSQGQFVIANLPTGSYTVTISYAGFAPLTKSVDLAVGQTASVDAVLSVASSNQTIQVVGDLHGEAEETQVQDTSPDIVNVISS